MKISATKEKILSIAESLIQTKGFNGFSYQDIADVVGIKKASIHHHFPTKEDLGKEVLNWYIEKLEIQLAKIAQEDTRVTAKLLDMFNLILTITGLTKNSSQPKVLPVR